MDSQNNMTEQIYLRFQTNHFRNGENGVLSISEKHTKKAVGANGNIQQMDRDAKPKNITGTRNVVIRQFDYPARADNVTLTGTLGEDESKRVGFQKRKRIAASFRNTFRELKKVRQLDSVNNSETIPLRTVLVETESASLSSLNSETRFIVDEQVCPTQEENTFTEMDAFNNILGVYVDDIYDNDAGNIKMTAITDSVQDIGYESNILLEDESDTFHAVDDIDSRSNDMPATANVENVLLPEFKAAFNFNEDTTEESTKETDKISSPNVDCMDDDNDEVIVATFDIEGDRTDSGTEEEQIHGTVEYPFTAKTVNECDKHKTMLSKQHEVEEYMSTITVLNEDTAAKMTFVNIPEAAEATNHFHSHNSALSYPHLIGEDEPLMSQNFKCSNIQDSSNNECGHFTQALSEVNTPFNTQTSEETLETCLRQNSSVDYFCVTSIVSERKPGDMTFDDDVRILDSSDEPPYECGRLTQSLHEINTPFNTQTSEETLETYQFQNSSADDFCVTSIVSESRPGYRTFDDDDDVRILDTRDEPHYENHRRLPVNTASVSCSTDLATAHPESHLEIQAATSCVPSIIVARLDHIDSNIDNFELQSETRLRSVPGKNVAQKCSENLTNNNTLIKEASKTENLSKEGHMNPDDGGKCSQETTLCPSSSIHSSANQPPETSPTNDRTVRLDDSTSANQPPETSPTNDRTVRLEDSTISNSFFSPFAHSLITTTLKAFIAVLNNTIMQ